MAPDALPCLLAAPSSRRVVPANFEGMNLTELRKVARTWLGPAQSKFAREPLVQALRKALDDDAAARRVFEALDPSERATAAVYRRYGGAADGQLIRVDLMARGLLEIAENPSPYGYSHKRWKRNPVRSLADRRVLISDRPRDSWSYGSHQETSTPFETYTLHPGIAGLVEPAGPARRPIPPDEAIPGIIARRPASEVAVELSRVFAYFAARDAVKVRKDGTLAVPALRSLEKAVPLGVDGDFKLPDRHALIFEILKGTGAIRWDGSEMRADLAAANLLFSLPDAPQAHAWARAWLAADGWIDGHGLRETGGDVGSSADARPARQIVAWALNGLASNGDRWTGLDAFLDGLRGFLGDVHPALPYGELAWEPILRGERGGEAKRGAARVRAGRFDRLGLYFANTVMVTLVALGLVERGASAGQGEGGAEGESWLFRLTGLGRAVFGAPETAPPVPEEATARRFLVIQPNFDVVAYLEHADAPSAAILGRVAEHDLARSGPVQTFRLTQKSLYQAQEGGLTHDRIVEFLRDRGQPDIPPNVLRTIADWSGRREALTVRSGVTLLGFPSEADRDSYVAKRPGQATPLGDRFATVPAPDVDAGRSPDAKGLNLPGGRVVDHLTSGPHHWTLDESGRITVRRPMDIAQAARLRRIAEPASPGGWRLTGDSVRRAAAGGLTGARIRRWLEDALDGSPPPIMFEAIDAWAGRKGAVELGDAVLLHVPDEAQFDAIADSMRFRPFLLGSPGEGWLVVRRDARKELADLLEELGFTVRGDLTHDAIDDDEGR